ncbi:MAG TPA: hypothetical protein VKJ45_14835, partial [Blastocatellia bacterium]|nr:hypothetical protein [Blastocatellia bacterium]
QGHLEIPRLRWKYAWIRPLLGSSMANYAQSALPQIKTSWLRRWDKALYTLEAPRSDRDRGACESHPSGLGPGSGEGVDE